MKCVREGETGEGGGGAAEERRESIMATLSKTLLNLSKAFIFGQQQSATRTAVNE